MNTIQLNSYSSRAGKVPQSFIREILKVASKPDIVSFAGGLPNPGLFPVEELKNCSAKVFDKYGTKALQYAETAGFEPLREIISQRYKQRYNLDISPEQVLITNGSQQALDLIGKLFLNPGDMVAIERPAYLGALQCFSMFEARFKEITLEEDGINTEELASALSRGDIKFLYGIPNFQNPTGISYSEGKRKAVAEILADNGTLFIEDDPYGELSFTGQYLKPVYSYLPEQTILLGSFSKIIAPGLRLGWMIANPEIIKRATVIKQASDLHSNNLSQYILREFIADYDLDKHIEKMQLKYREQRDCMLESFYHHLPFSVTYTRPEGGMFCWLKLPEGKTSRELLAAAIRENIVFVPGDAFYALNPDSQTARFNFSNVDKDTINEALTKLGKLI